MPRGEDRSVENGSTLTRGGRSHALALWEAMESAHTKGDRIHTAVDISANMQVVAMVANSTNPFVEDDAIRGANMLFLAGSDLQHILLDGGLLYATRCNDGVERLCTSTARVRATFENLCYVIISKDSTYYKNCSFGPFAPVSGSADTLDANTLLLFVTLDYDCYQPIGCPAQCLPRKSMVVL